MINLKLATPEIKHENLWYDFVGEAISNNENKIFNYYRLKHDCDDYIEGLEYIQNFNKNLPPHLVPQSVYFLIDENEEKLLGIIKIRHSLNEAILKRGGHIGYAIVPSERRKGYATKLLGLALKKCRELGIKKVLVTCDKNNIGSSKTITRNGGILENEYIEADGTVVQRFWIEN